MPDQYGWGGPQDASQFYGGISPEMMAMLDQENYGRMLTGQPPIEIPATNDPLQFATLLYFNNPDLAMTVAAQSGIPQEQLLQNVTTTNTQNQADRRSGWNPLLSTINATTRDFTENPLAFTAKLGALGTAMSFLPGASGAGGGSSAAVPSAAAPAGGAWNPALMGGASANAGLPAAGTSAGAWNPALMGGASANAGLPAAGAAGAANAGAGGGMLEGLLGGMNKWGPLVGGLLGAIDANNQPDSMTSNQGGNSASQYFTTFPDEIRGPAMDALSALRSMFGNGYQVAGADPASMAAISGLQGFAGGGGINPYLDTMFNSAADSTQTRLASEFARSGRNIAASAPARSEELQHLAAGIYGPGYEAERSRQFSSLLPLLGAGDYMRGIEQQRLDAPQIGLERFLGGLGGLMPLFPGTQNQTTQQTGSVTQPLFNNPWAGFLGGAQLGSLFQGA